MKKALRLMRRALAMLFRYGRSLVGKLFGSRHMTLLPPFEQRAVAFLDVLGFKDLVSRAETDADALAQLLALRDVIERHVDFDNASLAASVPPDVKPRYLFISDSIVLSVPVESGRYHGLPIVIAKTAQLSHQLLEMGYLLRGGIGVGPVWHDERNVIGTGYISAYLAEQQANNPRVVLTSEAATHWNNKAAANPASWPTAMCRQDGKDQIADTLIPSYITGLENAGRLEEAFRRYRNKIEAALRSLPPGSPPRAKWEWMAAYFNQTISANQIAVPTF